MMPTIKKTSKQGVSESNLVTWAFENDRKIILNTEINAESATELILQLEYLDKSGSGDITMYINSPGGVVSDGLAILDAMERCKCDISTVCTGIAASMASILCACGTKGKRFITPYAEIMIHQPLGGVKGQASDIERAATHITETKRVLMELLAERTGRSVEQIIADCDRDSYMNAEQSVKYGLVDAILK